MRVGILTREYPPDVYGGAGVHVEYLARELARHVDVRVHCFGEPRSSPLVAAAYQPWEALQGGRPEDAALAAMSVDLAMAGGLEGMDLVHSHTWYANLAGHLAKLVWDVPHVCTSHSLEPLRPWKAEQLGGGYALSLFCERTALLSADAVIAVSEAMRQDLLACYPAVDPGRVHTIYNGIDARAYVPDHGDAALVRYGIDPVRPLILFVGRIARQKGLDHLLRAAPRIDRAAQIVLIASAPDPTSIEHARAHCQEFFPWYNDEHRHSGLGLHTAADVHHGHATTVQTARAAVLAAAYQDHTERFVSKPPAPPQLPASSWINPPGEKQTAAQ